MKIKLGSVGVDSGQLMVTDTFYVKIFKNNEFDPKAKFYDSKKDKTLVYPDDFKNFEDDIIEGYNKNMNTLIKEKIFDEVKEKSNDKSVSLFLSVNFRDFDKIQKLNSLFNDKFKKLSYSIYESKTLY